MKGILSIIINKKAKTNKYKFFVGQYGCDYEMIINTSESLLKDLRTDNETLQQSLLVQSIGASGRAEQDVLNTVSKALDDNYDLFSNIEYLIIYGNDLEINNFILSNADIFNYKIIFDEVIPLDKEYINDFKNRFPFYKKIYVIGERNDDPVLLTDYEKTVDVIDGMVTGITSHNYSPIEQCMYAYDLIRDRYYQHEESDERYTESRDLTRALLGDKIVCLGFANIMLAVLKKLNISAKLYVTETEDKTESHARVLAYLDDKKYNINGYYFFDPTFDCKKRATNNFFLNSFQFFGKTLKQMNDIEEGKLKNSIYCCDEDFLRRHSSSNGIEKKTLDNMLVCSFSLLEELRGNSVDDIDLENVMSRYQSVRSLMEQPISTDVFLRALYNVRKNEYYVNPNKYPFSEESFLKAAVSFNGVKILPNEVLERIARDMGDQKRNEKVAIATSRFDDYDEQNEVAKSVNRVILARTLRSLLNKKEDPK